MRKMEGERLTAALESQQAWEEIRDQIAKDFAERRDAVGLSLIDLIEATRPKVDLDGRVSAGGDASDTFVACMLQGILMLRSLPNTEARRATMKVAYETTEVIFLNAFEAGVSLVTMIEKYGVPEDLKAAIHEVLKRTRN